MNRESPIIGRQAECDQLEEFGIRKNMYIGNPLPVRERIIALYFAYLHSSNPCFRKKSALSRTA